MPGIHETAYPRIKSDPSPNDLAAVYTPTTEEKAFAAKNTRQPAAKLGLLIQMKVFQRLGYFLGVNETPHPIIEHIAKSIGENIIPEELYRYDDSGARQRHLKKLRNYLKVTSVGDQTVKFVRKVAKEAARTKDDPADIVNVVLEELARSRFELPAFGTLVREANASRAAMNRRCFKGVYDELSSEAKQQIKTILKVKGQNDRSIWNLIKQEPKKPTVTNVKAFVGHLEWLKSFDHLLPRSFDIPQSKIKQFTTEARALNVANMNELKLHKRYTLAAILIRAQTGKAIDDIADIIIRIMQKLHSSANERLKNHQLAQTKKVDSLVSALHSTIMAYRSAGTKEQRFDAIDSLLSDESHQLLKSCEEHLAYANNNYLPFILNLYRSKRSLLFKCLDSLDIRSTTQDRTILHAIELLLLIRKSRKEWIDGGLLTSRNIDPSWIPDKWVKMVMGKRRRGAPVKRVHRKYLELCIFTQIAQELKSGDVYLVGGDKYDDYRGQLVSWDQYHEQIIEYGKLAGIITDAKTLIAHLKQWLGTTAKTTDDTFPDNNHVSIRNGDLTIHRNGKRYVDPEIEKIDTALSEHLPQSNILDILIDTEKRLNLSKMFKPLSGHKTKLTDHQKRFVATLFCYGCNLGPTQTARSVDGFSRRQLSWLNLRHVTEEKLDDAITRVVNAYNQFELPKFWGTGKSASADGTKWDVYEQNLLSEYHLRYAGYGGIGYYHISDTYIALFSHFIPCGVYEAVYILDGLLKNKSDVQPDTIHGDTQAQSETVFGLSYLLGIKLMPRIRRMKHLKYYRSDKRDSYKHIDELFSDTIKWELIEKYLPDMLRIAVSIKAGKITASTVLRRLGTYSRKNKLYQALRELGRVVRTVFLLQYISQDELRQLIQAATCKSEEFNDFVQWVLFGGEGVIAENLRHEQRKIIKYNHLVANMLILHNVSAMTKTIGGLMEKGYRIDGKILSGLAPFRREHINRFGNYVMNMERETQPFEHKLPYLADVN